MNTSNSWDWKKSCVLTFWLPLVVCLLALFSFVLIQETHFYIINAHIALGIWCAPLITLWTSFIPHFNMKWHHIENMTYLSFYPCWYGFNCPDIYLAQISQCWLANTSLEVVLTKITLSTFVDWNAWPFIMENELIIIPGQLSSKFDSFVVIHTQLYLKYVGYSPLYTSISTNMIEICYLLGSFIKSYPRHYTLGWSTTKSCQTCKCHSNL